MDDRCAAHVERINKLETANAIQEVHFLGVSKRLEAIEDTLKWIMRLIIGGLLMAILGFIFQGGLFS